MKYIGIDCGTSTGLAIWDSSEKRITSVQTLSLYKAFETVSLIAENEPVKVIFEDARKRRWIPQERSNSEYRGHLMGAGSVKRDSTAWEEFCKGKKIPYDAVAPRKGLTKWDKDTFAQVTGYKERTSHHGRDAALLVFGR